MHKDHARRIGDTIAKEGSKKTTKELEELYDHAKWHKEASMEKSEIDEFFAVLIPKK